MKLTIERKERDLIALSTIDYTVSWRPFPYLWKKSVTLSFKIADFRGRERLFISTDELNKVLDNKVATRFIFDSSIPYSNVYSDLMTYIYQYPNDPEHVYSKAERLLAIVKLIIKDSGMEIYLL